MKQRYWLTAFVIALGAAPLVLSSFQVTLINNIGLSALVVLGLVLLTGVAGMTSFGQAAFVGVGAYTTAYLTTAQDLPGWLAWAGGSPWLALIVGLALTLCIAYALGALTLRLSGHYLALGTLAWGLSLYFLFGTVEALGGHTGLANLPSISLFGLVLDQGEKIFYLIWLCVLLAMGLTRNLLDSREGRAIRALKGGQAMAESMGVNVFRSKLIAFLVAAFFAGLSGWLYAHTQRFVSPTPFSLNAGIGYLFMGLIGGVGEVWGAIAGAAVVTLSKQWLQDLLPQLLGQTGNFESIVFALIIIVVMHQAPRGLWPWLGGLARSGPRAARAPLETMAPLPRRAQPQTGTPILEVHGLTKQFGGLVANKDMALSLRAGEILAVIGPNGAGKSTLFNQLSCVEAPTAGTIQFLGKRIDRLSPREVSLAGLSRTFQHVKLLPNMSALENVAIGAHLRGRKSVWASALRLDRAEEARILHEARTQLTRVGLGAHQHEQAGSLALGQQRLLEIARALCADPTLLLLDEPAAGLRHKEKQALAELLRKLRAEGMGILLVEHDMDFVMGLVDRVVVMEFGQKIAEGLPATIQQDPRVLQAYLGEVE